MIGLDFVIAPYYTSNVYAVTSLQSIFPPLLCSALLHVNYWKYDRGDISCLESAVLVLSKIRYPLLYNGRFIYFFLEK